INILIHGVSRALIPLIADPLHGREHFDELPHLTGANVPALANVAVQRKRFVLGENVNLAQVGVDAIGKSYINDAIDPTEGHSRSGAVAGKRIKPFSSS